ncbi:MAG: peptidoglycan bridge formation glycyltransferase FemA/FemB family protein [Candidatus Paceibacterota bacterium]
MIIQEIKEKKTWENLSKLCNEKTFCQSWNWGEFNQKMGDSIWRFGVYENEKIIALSQVIKISARRGTFLFVPHGPIFITTGQEKKVISLLLDHLKELGYKNKADFIRVAPLLERNKKNISIYKELGFRTAPTHMHPELTWQLDLCDSEEKLLANMRKTTRYLIKQGEKNKNVLIEKTQNYNDLKAFEEVYKITADRHSFVPFSMEYLKNELEAFNKDDEILIFSGKYNGEIIASAMIIYWDKEAFYHQGASSLKYPKIPVSYLLQWEAIKEGKKRGCKTYNFWGIAPESELEAKKNHPWKGLSLFKKGFGGYKKEYVKTQDYPLSLKYWPICIFEEIRKRKRNL